MIRAASIPERVEQRRAYAQEILEYYVDSMIQK